MSYRLSFLLLLYPAVCCAHITEIRSEAGGFVAGLSVDPAGIQAGQSIELFVRIRRLLRAESTGLSETDPFESATEAAACADLSSRIVMPSMPGMPAIVPVVRSLGYPGSYALKMAFPHGGSYRLNLAFTPVSAAAPLSVTFILDVTDETTDLSSAPRPFVLKVASRPGRIAAGKAVQLSLSVWSRDTGNQTRRFEVVHEKLVHLIIVRDDLGQFFHEHPARQPDGTFALTFKFPTAGPWRLFADMAPEGAGSQVAVTPLTVSGKPPRRELLAVTAQPVVTRGNSVLVMHTARIVARRPASLVLELRDASGDKVSDLEPWLGAAAHLILISQDASTFVHAHSEGGNGNVTGEGPLVFQSRFPKAGIYKAWLQFQRSGKIVTLSFVVRVLDQPG